MYSQVPASATWRGIQVAEVVSRAPAASPGSVNVARDVMGISSGSSSSRPATPASLSWVSIPLSFVGTTSL